MKINVLGDSITSGGGAGGIEKGFIGVLRNITTHEIRAYGLGGTRIARQTIPSAIPTRDNDFQMRALEMEKDADYVLVFGGTNDYGHGDAKLGSFNDCSPYTFYGALHCLAKYLVETYGKEKVCFLTPLHRFNEDDPWGDVGVKKEAVAPLSKYVDAIKEIVEAYGFDLLDLYGENFIPIPSTDLGDEYTIDGLHPNVKWHAKLAERIAVYLTEKSKTL